MKNKYKVLIIVCWVVYIICFILKLCGANWFKIACTNEDFINACNYVDNTKWLLMTISALNFVILCSLIILAMLGQKFYTPLQAIVFIPLFVITSIVGWYNSIANTILSFIVFLLPIAFNYKKWYRVLIGIFLYIVFQLISILTKSVDEFYLNNTSSLVAIILQIDVYILALIYYLFANARKEIN